MCLCTLVTQEAPDFTANAVMPDNSFAPLTLSSYRGKYEPIFSVAHGVLKLDKGAVQQHDAGLASIPLLAAPGDCHRRAQRISRLGNGKADPGGPAGDPCDLCFSHEPASAPLVRAEDVAVQHAVEVADLGLLNRVGPRGRAGCFILADYGASLGAVNAAALLIRRLVVLAVGGVLVVEGANRVLPRLAQVAVDVAGGGVEGALGAF